MIRLFIIVLYGSLLYCSELGLYSPTNVSEIVLFCNAALNQLVQKSSILKISNHHTISWQSKLFFGKSAQDKKDRDLFSVLLGTAQTKKWSIGKIKTKNKKWGVKLYQDTESSLKKNQTMKKLKEILCAMRGTWYSTYMDTYHTLGLMQKSLTHNLYQKEQSPIKNGSIYASEYTCIRILARYFDIAMEDIDAMIQFSNAGDNVSVIKILGPHQRNMLYLSIDKEKFEYIQTLFNFTLSKKYM